MLLLKKNWVNNCQICDKKLWFLTFALCYKYKSLMYSGKSKYPFIVLFWEIWNIWHHNLYLLYIYIYSIASFMLVLAIYENKEAHHKVSAVVTIQIQYKHSYSFLVIIPT